VTPNSVSESIRELYEAYPYPTRIPGGSADPFLEYLRSFTNKPHKRKPTFFDAGCGTGLNVLGGAAIYPHFDVYGCDLNRVALKQLESEAKNLGFSNLFLRELDLLDLDCDFGPPEGFDIIFSTGVIHHTPDPVGILKSLAKRLAPQGILRLMVYGELGRSDLYRFARVARKLCGGDSHSWSERVQKGRELMSGLKTSGSARDNFLPPVFRGPWEDAQRVDEVEFADRYLNPHDQPFSISTLADAIARANLKFHSWFEPREWDLKRLLPKFAESPLAPSDPWQQFALIEELFDRPKLDLYLVGPEFEARVPKVEPQTLIGLNPQLFLSCVKARGVSFHRVAQLRLYEETVLSREEGTLLEAIGTRFLPVQTLVQEMPNPSLDHWLGIVRKLVSEDMLFCPHA